MNRRTLARTNGANKWLVLFLCLTLIFSGQVTFANKYSEYESVELIEASTGQTKTYAPVNIMVGGQDIFFDAPGIIDNGRTLVPVAAIFQELGVPYEWNGTTREIAFTHGSKRVVLKIDSPYATVNGTKTTLPDSVPPRIMTYKNTAGESVGRTYVPLRFISEMLDLSITWLGETRTVAINKKAQKLTGIRIPTDVNYGEIRFKVTGEVDVTSYVVDGATVGGKDKIILDFQNTSLTPPSGVKLVNGVWTYNTGDGIYGVRNIEIKQNNTSPVSTQVVINQNDKRGSHVYYDKATSEIVVQLINTVNGITLEKKYGTDTIVIDTRQLPPDYYPQIVGNQMILDVINSKLKINGGAYQVLPVNKGKIEAIAYQQLNTKGSDIYSPEDEVTRITIQFTEAITYDDFFVEDIGSDIFVYVTEEPIYNFNYVMHSTEKSVLSIDVNALTESTINYNESTRMLSLQIPRDKTSLASFTQQINDHLVEQITVSDGGSFYLVEAKLTANTTYVKSSTTRAVTLTFSNRIIQDSVNQDKLIVIDAGHGGKDPGALGTKTQEKVIALRASELLKTELQKLGYKVYMTRSTDEYVGLYDRAAMANDLSATLFVSIHMNAFTNPNTSGVEVLYANESLSSDKGLAQSIQKELISSLGAVDRGVKAMPRLVVLKETLMTSVLCELGFITNPNEQEKLMTDAYLIKAAAAMAKGISNFLK